MVFFNFFFKIKKKLHLIFSDLIKDLAKLLKEDFLNYEGRDKFLLK